MSPTETEAHRLACEARYWIRRSFDEFGRLDNKWLASILADVEKIRGKQSCDKLRAQMRLEWEQQQCR